MYYIYNDFFSFFKVGIIYLIKDILGFTFREYFINIIFLNRIISRYLFFCKKICYFRVFGYLFFFLNFLKRINKLKFYLINLTFF